MNDKRVSDVKLFCNYWLEHFKLLDEETDLEFQKFLQKRANHWFHKWMDKILPPKEWWLRETYGFERSYNEMKLDLPDYLNKIAYYEKMGYDLMTFNKWEREFYKFAKENNLPY